MAERLSDLTAAIRAQPPGHEFLKAVWLIAKHRGNLGAAAAESPRFVESSPNLERVMKAAVNAGGTGASEWGTDVAGFYRLAAEWVVLQSRRTVLGRLSAVRVPFQTRTIVDSSSAAGSFVGGGRAIPAKALSLANTATMMRFKVGCIAAFTNESLEVWGPAIQANLNDRLGLAVQRGMDVGFLDPDSAGAAGETPASITNGISPLGDLTNTAGGALADISTLLAAHVDAGSDLDRVLIAMHPSTALVLSLMQSSGQYTFPQMTATGGSIVGVPVVTSVGCQRSGSPNEKLVVACDGGKVTLADDGGVEISAGRLAALQLDDAATNAADSGTATNMVSMFQVDSTALKAVRFINFQRAHASAVSWMTAAF